MDLELVLRRAVELGASDIHLKVERPPMLRRDGSVSELDEVAVAADDGRAPDLQVYVACAVVDGAPKERVQVHCRGIGCAGAGL